MRRETSSVPRRTVGRPADALVRGGAPLRGFRTAAAPPAARTAPVFRNSRLLTSYSFLASRLW